MTTDLQTYRQAVQAMRQLRTENPSGFAAVQSLAGSRLQSVYDGMTHAPRADAREIEAGRARMMQEVCAWLRDLDKELAGADKALQRGGK